MRQIFSPNMLNTYNLCPKKYYFRFVKNIAMPIDDSLFELGKNIHAIASYYLKKQNIYKMEASLTQRENLIWEYQQEWRLIGNAGEKAKAPKIKAIHLGLNVSEENENKVREFFKDKDVKIIKRNA